MQCIHSYHPRMYGHFNMVLLAYLFQVNQNSSGVLGHNLAIVIALAIGFYSCFFCHASCDDLLVAPTLHTFNGLFSRTTWVSPERQTILDFTEARGDGVAMASAGPYANHLHFAPDMYHANISWISILQARCPSWLMPSQQCQCTEGITCCPKLKKNRCICCGLVLVHDLHIWSSWCHCHPVISCFIKIQNRSAFLVPAYPCCLGKEAVKWM